MTREARVKALFHAALDVEEDRRVAFVRSSVTVDTDIRREVEAMLAFDREADSRGMLKTLLELERRLGTTAGQRVRALRVRLERDLAATKTKLREFAQKADRFSRERTLVSKKAFEEVAQMVAKSFRNLKGGVVEGRHIRNESVPEEEVLDCY